MFEPTLTFSVPTSDWVNVADVGGDFGLRSTHDIGDVIIFFRDARSLDDAVGATVSEIEHWLETNDKLTVTPAAPAKVGGLTGVTLDLRVRPGAVNADPGCPVQLCVPLLRRPRPACSPAQPARTMSVGRSRPAKSQAVSQARKL